MEIALHVRLQRDATLAFRTADLRQVVDYWTAKRGSRLMPARADIDPVELRSYVARIMLTDVVEEASGARFRFRLVGTEIARNAGRDSTGRFWDEVFPAADYDEMASAMRWVMRSHRPMRSHGNLWHLNREWLAFESVDLPLSPDDRRVDMVLTCFAFG